MDYTNAQLTPIRERGVGGCASAPERLSRAPSIIPVSVVVIVAVPGRFLPRRLLASLALRALHVLPPPPPPATTFIMMHPLIIPSQPIVTTNSARGLSTVCI